MTSRESRIERLRQVAAELKDADDEMIRARKIKEEAVAAYRKTTARHRELLAMRQELVVALGIAHGMGPVAIAREGGMDYAKASLYVNRAKRESRDSA